MTPIDEPASFEPKGSAPEARKAKTASGDAEPPVSADFVSVTIETPSGRILSVEAVDPAGTRRELSDDERASLARGDGAATLQSIVEQAFEAGIHCALGGDAQEDEPPESEADAELRRALLHSLIERSAVAKRLMRGDALGRAAVGTLVAQAPGARAH